jgi:hypothetical protein
MLCYLAEGTPLLPAERWARAKVLEWLFFEQYSHEPYIATVRYWIKYLGKAVEWAEKIAATREKGYAALAVMERQLQQTPFLAGDALTVADVALAAYTQVAHEGGFDLARFPALRRWLAAVHAHPGLAPLQYELYPARRGQKRRARCARRRTLGLHLRARLVWCAARCVARCPGAYIDSGEKGHHMRAVRISLLMVALASSPAWASETDSSARLGQLFAEDQAVRAAAASREVNWEVVGRADAKRREEILSLMKRGRVSTATDYYHAAMIYQHAQEPDELRLAYSLAWISATLNPNNPRARSLADSLWERLAAGTTAPAAAEPAAEPAQPQP